MKIEWLFSLYLTSLYSLMSCRTPTSHSSDVKSAQSGSPFSCRFTIPDGSSSYFEIAGTPTSQGLMNIKSNYRFPSQRSPQMRSLAMAPLASRDALIGDINRPLSDLRTNSREIRSFEKSEVTIDQNKFTCYNVSGVGPKKEDYLCIDSSLNVARNSAIWVSDFRYATDLNALTLPGSTCTSSAKATAGGGGSFKLDAEVVAVPTNTPQPVIPPPSMPIDAQTSATPAQTNVAVVNHSNDDVLPPDFFKDPKDGSRYRFPTNLEKPCDSRSKFCANYGPDGIPSDWVLARYKSRHAGGFDPGTASLLMVYVPPGAIVNGTKDRVHRWLNFALPTDPSPLDAQPTPLSAIPAQYSPEMPKTFTMVSVTEGTPAKVHFTKFYRKSDEQTYVPEGRINAGSCMSCHPNGPRAISPLGYHVDAVEAADPNKMLEESTWRAVEKINNAMESSLGGAPAAWDEAYTKKTIDPPFIGLSTPVNPSTRTKEYILGDGNQTGCATNKKYWPYLIDIFGRAPGRKNIYTMSEKPNLDWEKIRDAMDCQSCHDNKTRGALTDTTGPSQIAFKILVDQSMPFGSLEDPFSNPTRHYSNTLDIDHRIALINCLLLERDKLRYFQ